MKDVFRGAKFGEMYKTEGRLRLVYIRYEVKHQRHMLVSPLGRYVFCDHDGRVVYDGESQYNVIEKENM